MDVEWCGFPTSPKKTSLFNLPEEILILILEFLRPDQPLTTFPPRLPASSPYTDLCRSWTNATPPPWPLPTVPRSLYAFTLVCKRARQLSTPVLYHAITLQTMDITNRLGLHLQSNPENGLLVKHLFMPHDGMMHRLSDRLAGADTWAQSWRSILKAACRLESLFLVTRPDGKALQELFNHASDLEKGISIRRLTIGSLSYSIPDLAVGSVLHAPYLSHLHLIQWVPSTLIERFGGQIYHSLRYLRLSRLAAAPFQVTVAIGQNAGDVLEMQDLFHQNNVARHPVLSLLREAIEHSRDLEVVILELQELGPLDMPEELSAWDENKSPIDEEAPFDDDWAHEAHGREARSQYWANLLQLKRLLSRYSSEIRGPHSHPIEFKIVAPRPGGWDRNETLIDFHANAAACRGEMDKSAFMDDDVFELTDRFPYLGHDYGHDPSGRRVAYWTGALPKGVPEGGQRTDVPMEMMGQAIHRRQ